MFADQDDVWLPHKIERAWQHLRGLDGRPALYASAQMLADENLRPLQATPPWPRGPSFAGALVENIVTGCTAAINGPAILLLRQGGVPPGVHFHDWWLYLVVSAFGTVVFDEVPSLLYRQHGANHIGRGAGRIGRIRQMVRFMIRNDWVGILAAQAGELQRRYGARLAADQRELMSRYFIVDEHGAKPRWRLVFSPRRWRQTALDELALRLLLTAKLLRLWPPRRRRLT
jgi:hypothetical protein